MSYHELDENSKTIKHPPGLSIKLRAHQLTSITAMIELENQSTIMIDQPKMGTGMYSTARCKMSDDREISGSTFMIETNSAILADKVGSGKTYMIIGLLLAQKKPQDHNRFLIGTDHFSIRLISNKECNNTNLIVVPHNLANQWGEFMENSTLKYLKLNTQSDFDCFFDIDYVDKQFPVPGCKVTRYSAKIKKNISANKSIKTIGGSKTAKNTSRIIYARYSLNEKKVKKILDRTDVIILNVNRYRFFKQIFSSNKWARVIIDEMDSANIPPMFDEIGNFNWFLTATPTAIFTKSCRRYVNKIFGYHHALLPYFTVKNTNEYVDKSIILPKPRVFMIEAMVQRVIAAFKEFLPNEVLKLINAGNMKEAINKLNCDVNTEENVIDVLTKNLKKELHNLNKELEFVKALVVDDDIARENRIKKIEKEISSRKTRLETINEKIKTIKDECCFICANSFDTPAILDCCKNVFCLKCLLNSLQTGTGSCPYCRAIVKGSKGYHVIADPTLKKSESFEKSNKKSKTEKLFTDMEKSDVLEHVLKHISKNVKNPRILIFSDYRQTFDKIIKNITNAGLCHAMMTGIPAHITNVINDFNGGNLNVLMLDSQHYGSGLNLQAADFIILYHRMTNELETQVIGRAQRFGRQTPLTIIYIVNDNESKQIQITTTPINIQNQKDLNFLTNIQIDNDNNPTKLLGKTKKNNLADKKKIDNATDEEIKKITIKKFTSRKKYESSVSDDDDLSNMDSDSEESEPIKKPPKKYNKMK
jgi:hypothetical protein